MFDGVGGERFEERGAVGIVLAIQMGCKVQMGWRCGRTSSRSVRSRGCRTERPLLPVFCVSNPDRTVDFSSGGTGYLSLVVESKRLLAFYIVISPVP